MDLERVEILVDSLACACEAALNLYARWSAKQATENRYHNSRSGRRFSTDSVKSAPTSSQAHAPIKCATSTSLEMSSYRIRSTYQIGVTLIGSDFADGDVQCRESLSYNLSHMMERLHHLNEAVSAASAQRQPIALPLNELYHSSEYIRLQSVSALASQYRRFAFGRAIPQEIPIPRAMPSKLHLWEEDEDDDFVPAPRAVERPQPPELPETGSDYGEEDSNTPTPRIGQRGFDHGGFQPHQREEQRHEFHRDSNRRVEQQQQQEEEQEFHTEPPPLTWSSTSSSATVTVTTELTALSELLTSRSTPGSQNHPVPQVQEPPPSPPLTPKAASRSIPVIDISPPPPPLPLALSEMTYTCHWLESQR